MFTESLNILCKEVLVQAKEFIISIKNPPKTYETNSKKLQKCANQKIGYILKKKEYNDQRSQTKTSEPQ